MLSTDSNQVCSICGKVIPLSEVNSNSLFEEARCTPCFKQYGDVPLETLKAELSVHDLEVKKIPTEKWHDLIMLQKKKWNLKLETDEKITKAKSSILNIGRENKIDKIKKGAAEERKIINTEIRNLILELKDSQGLIKQEPWG